MAVSPACIAAVRDASGGALTEQDAADLIRRMEELRRAEEAKGDVDQLDARLRALAAAEAERAQIAAALRAKHAAMQAIALDRAFNDATALIDQGLGYRKGLLALAEGTTRNVAGGRASIAATALAYRARYLETLNLWIVRNPEAARLMRDGDPGFARATAREMLELREGGNPGSTGNRDAAALARAYADMAEATRRDLNRLGAPIGRLDGWAPQHHAAERIVKASPDEWTDFVLPRLDRERTFPGASDDALRAALRDIHTAIVTGVERLPGAAETTGRIGPANLANSLAARRVLHFKDAAAWITYAERFGAGNIHDAMLGHLTGAARMAAQLDRLGPNPEANWTRLRAMLARRASRDANLTPAERAKAAQAMRNSSRLDSAWAEVSGLTAQPGNTRAAQIGTTIRAAQAMAKLGSAVISSATDLALRTSALTFQGRPIARAWADNLAELMQGRGAGEQREIAALLDAGVDGIKGHMTAAGMAEDLPIGKLHRLTQLFYRIQGMTWWTDAMKAGASRMLSRWMGNQAGSGWNQLPARYQATLRQQGIGPAEWNAIRSTAWQAKDGHTYVTPDRLRQLPRQALIALAREDLEAMQAGTAARAARRAEADAREAAWLAKRRDQLNLAVGAAVDRLRGRNAAARGRADKRAGALRARLEEMQQRLDELAEFQDAIAEGRAWEPADAVDDIAAWRPGDDLPPDLAEAEARSAELTAQRLTSGINTPEREALRIAAIGRVEQRRLAEIGGAPAQERRALLVIGPPSAGKSTIIEPLARNMRALIIDSDDMKAELPEFENGLGAMRVHKESSEMALALRERNLMLGNNVAIPTVGNNPDGLLATIANFKAAGYRVTLVLNDLPIEHAARRNMRRFRDTGRLVGHEYLMGIGSKPRDTYMKLRDLADEAAHYSNDVPRGADPVLAGGSDLLAEGRPGPSGSGQLRASPLERGPAEGGGQAPTGNEGGVAPTSANTFLSITPPAAASRTFSPRSERYLDDGNPATLAARAEGELRARLDALRRAIGAVGRQATMGEQERLQGFGDWWNRRTHELEAYARRAEERGAARAAETAAETADYARRVDRILEDTRARLELKLRGFFADEMGFAFLETNAQTRRLTLMGTQAGTGIGEILRYLTQFKGFPVAFTARILGRALQGYSPDERLLQGRNLGTLIGGLLVLGYVSMSAKDLLRGYGPRDPERWDTILAALLQSGGAGIYGDFLFAQANRFGNTALESAAGPVAGSAGAIVNLFGQALQGEATAAQGLNIVLSNTPFASLWYVRPTLDFLVLNSLREALSPGFVARQQQRRREEFGQERLLPAHAF